MSLEQAAASDWILIEDDESLAEALDSFTGAQEIAVDTEFMRRNTFYPQIALLQLCAGDRAYLIDPQGIHDLDGIRALLTKPDLCKLLHSCSEDLEVFRHWLGVLPTPLIDTQRAMAILGEGFGMGYRAMVQQLLGLELEKGETRSDWLRRPLTNSQCHYAAQDVLQLWRAWPQLRERAHATERMSWLLEDGTEAVRALTERDRDIHLRIKGAGKLDPRQLAVLQELSQWREHRAQHSDKPRGWIVEDKACIAIAQQMPGDAVQLAALDVLPASVLRKQGSALIGCVEKALALVGDDLPSALPRALNPEQRSALKALRAAAKRIAEEHAIAPEILVTGADLELLVRAASGETIVEPARWNGWRGSLVIEPLRRASE